MTAGGPIVFVVDDASSVREALSSLIRSVGLRVQTFASAHEFQAHPRSDAAACIVLDVRMPGPSGLDLQRALLDAGDQIPIIFITGHGDIPMSVRAMKAGATEFLPKPFRDEDLLNAIGHAIECDQGNRLKRAELTEIRDKYDTLTLREREVIVLIVKGMLNKLVAAELGITETTVKVHRHNIMQKMQTRSLPALARMVEKLGLSESSRNREYS